MYQIFISPKNCQRNILIGILILLVSCSKNNDQQPSTNQGTGQGTTTPGIKPTANFTFTLKNQGFLPDTVSFVSTSTATTTSTTYRWSFDDGKTDTTFSPQHIYSTAKSYNVKLVVRNQYGKDSITQVVAIPLNKPVAGFNVTISNMVTLPVGITLLNTSSGSNVSYLWTFGDGTTSTAKTPAHSYQGGGVYEIQLQVTNASGTAEMSDGIQISPYPQPYITMGGQILNLYSWKGNSVEILSNSSVLNRTAMFEWVHSMDTAYQYYKKATGAEPAHVGATYFNQRDVIAEVTSTCGAACSYLGSTGTEIETSYFDNVYNRVNTNNTYYFFPFYELGRQFWFYGNQLAYKANDPVTTGFAVFMGFSSMSGSGINGDGPSVQVALVDQYVADPTLNWSNTLALNQSIPGTSTTAPDLFSSFCFRLARDYGGETFIENIWKQAALRPAAVTTQDAVDNFVLAACAAANKNLTSLFINTWRWPVSSSAQTAASKYPQ